MSSALLPLSSLQVPLMAGASSLTPAVPLKLGVTVPLTLQASTETTGTVKVDRLIDPAGAIKRPVNNLFGEPLKRLGGLTLKAIDLSEQETSQLPTPASPVDILILSGLMDPDFQLIDDLSRQFLARVILFSSSQNSACYSGRSGQAYYVGLSATNENHWDIHFNPLEQTIRLNNDESVGGGTDLLLSLNKGERVRERLEKSFTCSVWRTLTERFLESGKIGSQDAAQRAQRAINLGLPLAREYLTFLELDWNRSQDDKADKGAQLIRPWTDASDFDVEQAFERFRFEWGEFQFPRRD